MTPRSAGLEGTTPYLVQEYVSGEALDVWMRDAGGALPVHRALAVVRALARAIDAACDQGIGHGALHARDVFIGASESDVRVTGFGIAQALARAGGKAPVRRPYAAPERVAAQDWDRRADIYSLAAIAQELCPDARDSWGPMLERGMAADPDARFRTATELANALAGDAVIVTAEQADAALESLPVEPVSEPSPLEPEEPVFEQAGAALPSLLAQSDAPHVDLPLPAKTPLDFGFDEVEVEVEKDVIPARLVAPERRFPWAAMTAVAAAMFVAGGALFYGVGFDRGRQEPPSTSIAAVTPPAETVPPPPGPEVTPEPAPPAPPPVFTPERTVTPERTPPPQRAELPERPRARTGTVNLDSRPRGATVTIDGRRLGPTPRAVELSPGSHSVLIQLAGHRPVRASVDVVAGRQTRLAVTLEQLNGLPDHGPGLSPVRKDR